MRLMTKEAREAHIGEIFNMLSSLHDKTKHGYVPMSLSEFVKQSGVVDPGNVAMALTQKNIVRCIGSNRDRKCHWIKGEPNLNMAGDVFEHVRLHKMKTKTQKLEDKKYTDKTRNLVPVLDKDNKPVRREAVRHDDSVRTKKYLNILNELYKERAFVINTRALSLKYEVNEKEFFGPLIELDILQPSEKIQGQYMWKGEEPSEAMVELMLFAASPKTQKELEMIEGTLKFMKHVQDISPYNGGLSEKLKECGLPPAYLTVMKNLGIIKNIGTSVNPRYTYNGSAPNENIANRVRREVNAYYNRANKAYQRSIGNDRSVIITKPPVDVNVDPDLLINTNASVRTINALKNVDITKISQLEKMTETGLHKIRGFGLTCIEDVKQILAERGKSLLRDNATDDEQFRGTLDAEMQSMIDQFSASQPNDFGKAMVSELTKLLNAQAKLQTKIDSICRVMRVSLEE